MNPAQSFTIAVLQGVTELFPISSLGHAIIVPALLGWAYDPHQLGLLPFLVMLHLGTSAALFLYFWRDWVRLFSRVLGVGSAEEVAAQRRLALMLVIGTLPAIIIGFLVEKKLRAVFESPVAAASFLAINGVLLIICDALRRRMGRQERSSLATLTPVDALWIGLAQCLAFLPGISRSGATISSGLLRGLDHDDSARFSFLLALPIILAATALQFAKFHAQHLGMAPLLHTWAPGLVAGLTALASTALLMRYFRQHEDWALWPFAVYCVIAGLGSLAYLTI